VFALVNLPETVKGALFARYSRYPGTLRRLFLDEFADSLPATGASYDNDEGRRAAEPYRMVCSGQRWYVVAWDSTRSDWRTFRVDRMRLRTPNGPRFTAREPPGGDLARYVAEQISVNAYRYRARVVMHAPADVVAARLPPTVATVEPDGDDACVLRTGANSLDELATWIAQVGVAFTVREPPELVDHLRALAARILDATR